MTEPNWLVRSGATPAKLAAICVLALALVAVVWHNASRSATPAVKKTRLQPTQLSEVVTTKVPTADMEKVARKWPKLSLDKVVKNDPFAMPMWYLMAQADEVGTAGASLARSAQVLEELKKQQTRIVMISNEDRVATIGELSFRVGDRIEGFQVTAITTDGIVLTEVER